MKQIALAVVVVILGALVLYAAVHETAKQPLPARSAAAAYTGGLGTDQSSLGALSPEEEAYATTLWPIHNEIKLAAVRMTFAGMNYKIEHQDRGKIKAAVQPLIRSFQSAAQRISEIKPPDALADAHRSYLEALRLYTEAAREMVKTAEDGRDEHLFAAHERSERASRTLLQLSDVLWPGEYRPN